MREFGYTRRKQTVDPDTGLPGCGVDIRYEEVIGSHYLMRSYIKHAYGDEELENTIDVDLAKEGQNKVRIQISYYSGHTIDKPGYETSLKQRVFKSA